MIFSFVHFSLHFSFGGFSPCTFSLILSCCVESTGVSKLFFNFHHCIFISYVSFYSPYKSHFLVAEPFSICPCLLYYSFKQISQLFKILSQIKPTSVSHLSLMLVLHLSSTIFLPCRMPCNFFAVKSWTWYSR